MNVIQKVRSILQELRSGARPAAAAENWALVGRLLPRMTSELATVQKVVAEKDLDGLAALLDRIEHRVADAAAKQAALTFSEADLAAAFKAFEKRLALGRLADESRLGGRYTSGGRKSSIDGIQPPDGFPAGIWQALVRAGKLQDLGEGFYCMPGRTP
ncbi:MAG: hypothetical protein WCK33_01025 [Phycisphaerae bacterium]